MGNIGVNCPLLPYNDFAVDGSAVIEGGTVVVEGGAINEGGTVIVEGGAVGTVVVEGGAINEGGTVIVEGGTTIGVAGEEPDACKCCFGNCSRISKINSYNKCLAPQ